MTPKEGLDRVELVRKADVALYHAKAAGRSSYALFGVEMDHTMAMRKGLERDLRERCMCLGKFGSTTSLFTLPTRAG